MTAAGLVLWNLALLFTIAGAACSFAEPAAGPETELVLQPGDVLRASTPRGPLTVEAPGVQTRHYVWDGRDTTFDLAARPERWYGSLGIYGQSGDLVAEEGSFNFATERAFEAWARPFGTALLVRNDGYAAALRTAPNGNTDIDVYRICIAGHAVTRLSGADDTALTVEHHAQSGSPSPAWYGCARYTYDPIAYQESSARQAYDIDRQVDFWSETQYSCNAVTQDAKQTVGSTLESAELVIHPGNRIDIRNAFGPLTISAPTEDTRTLVWTNENPRPPGFKPLEPEPKTITFSLYHPVQNQNEHSGAFGCNRISGSLRYVVNYEEAQINFASVAAFKSWLSWPTHTPLYLGYVFRDDGLLAGYRLGFDSGMDPKINVDLFQVCIAGKKPSALPGAHSKALSVHVIGATRTSVKGTYTCPAAVTTLDSSENER